jgi:hypothetical protein
MTIEITPSTSRYFIISIDIILHHARTMKSEQPTVLTRNKVQIKVKTIFHFLPLESMMGSCSRLLAASVEPTQTIQIYTYAIVQWPTANGRYTVETPIDGTGSNSLTAIYHIQ